MANQSYRRSKHHRGAKAPKVYEAPINPKVWERQLQTLQPVLPDADELFDRLDNADPGTGFKGNKT
jgi:hypothetical protein